MSKQDDKELVEGLQKVRNGLRARLRHPINTLRNMKVRDLPALRLRHLRAAARPRKLGGVVLYGNPIFHSSKVAFMSAGLSPEEAEGRAIRVTAMIVASLAAIAVGVVKIGQIRAENSKRAAAEILKKGSGIADATNKAPGITPVDRAAATPEVQAVSEQIRQQAEALMVIQQTDALAEYENHGALTVSQVFGAFTGGAVTVISEGITSGTLFQPKAIEKFEKDNSTIMILEKAEQDFMVEGSIDAAREERGQLQEVEALEAMQSKTMVEMGTIPLAHVVSDRKSPLLYVFVRPYAGGFLAGYRWYDPVTEVLGRRLVTAEKSLQQNLREEQKAWELRWRARTKAWDFYLMNARDVVDPDSAVVRKQYLTELGEDADKIDPGMKKFNDMDDPYPKDLEDVIPITRGEAMQVALADLLEKLDGTIIDHGAYGLPSRDRRDIQIYSEYLAFMSDDEVYDITNTFEEKEVEDIDNQILSSKYLYFDGEEKPYKQFK
jgi:hypothetical protein